MGPWAWRWGEGKRSDLLHLKGSICCMCFSFKKFMKTFPVIDVQRGPSILTEAGPSDRHEIPYLDQKYCLSDIPFISTANVFPIKKE